MKNFIICISVIVFSVMNITAYAQTDVTGRVLDSETREGEVAAIVQLLRSGDNLTYTITDSTGYFILRTKADGALTIKIENLGRKTVEREFNAAAGGTVDLGEILIENDAETLKESSVSALRTLVKIGADRLSYDVEHDIDAKSMTALDLLRKVPMVTVDAQDNITVNGSSSFKVYVDGRPNQMLSNNPSQMFKVMPASLIKSIEVVTNPGAKYDAEGTGGILDVKTMSGAGKSVTTDGIFGTVMAGVDTRGRANGGVSINAQKGKWTFGANIHGMRENLGGIEMSSTTTYSETATSIETLTRGSNKGGGIFSNVSVGFEPDTLNLFNLTVGVNSFGNNSIGNDGRTTYTVAGIPTLSYSQSTVSKMSMSFINASFDYQHTFADSRDKTLTLSYQFSGNPQKGNSLYDLTYDDGRTEERHSVTDDLTSEHTVQTDFTTPIGKNQTLSSGLKYIYRHNSADDAYNGIPSVYDYYNHIGAAYTEYTATIKNLVLTAGLRYEHTFQTVDYDLADKDFDINYGNFVPNASLQWNLSEAGNLSLAYNMRIRRPGINSLNPFVDQSDPTSRSYGNPDVRAERNHRISLAYNFASPKWVISAKLRERLGKGGISEYSFYDGSILNHTYGNIISRSSTGLDIYANWNINNKTRLYVNGDVDYNILSSKELDQRNSGWEYGVFAGFQTSVFWDMRLSLNTFINGGDISLQGHSSPFRFGMLGLTKTFFNDRLSVSVQGTSPLFSRDLIIREYSEGKGFSSESVVKIPIMNAGFNISYTFGQMRGGGKKVRRTIDNDDVDQNTGGGSIIPDTGGMGM